MYCIVSPFWKTFDEIGLTYFVPDFLEWEIKLWQIVEIPIKDKIEIAVVINIISEDEIWDLAKDKIKSIISIYNNHVFFK